MGIYNGQLPETLQDMVDVWNAANPGWNMWVDMVADDQFIICEGDQLRFTAFTQQEAEAFLAGCYNAAPHIDRFLHRLNSAP